MNKVNIDFMIGYMSQVKEHEFNMADWGINYGEQAAECGTEACIAGWTAKALTGQVGLRPWSTARIKFNITHDQADDLFTNDLCDATIEMDTITIDDAIHALTKPDIHKNQISVNFSAFFNCLSTIGCYTRDLITRFFKI